MEILTHYIVILSFSILEIDFSAIMSACSRRGVPAQLVHVLLPLLLAICCFCRAIETREHGNALDIAQVVTEVMRPSMRSSSRSSSSSIPQAGALAELLGKNISGSGAAVDLQQYGNVLGNR